MLDRIPETLRAGDTWTWRTTAPPDKQPGDGWALSVAIRGEFSLDVLGVADDSGWISTAPAAGTANLVEGIYAWQERATRGDEVHTVRSGSVRVLPSLADTCDGHDARSVSRKQLDAVNEAITGLLSKQHATVSFGDQSYSLQDVEKLFRIRDRLRQEVQSEDARANGGKGRRILVTFGGR